MRKHTDVGILILRLGIGAMFLYHGAPKLLAGPEKWSQLGTAMSSISVTTVPALWGLMASVSEFFGGICLILGIFSRGASFLLLFAMFIASSWHLKRGDGLIGSSHAIELGIVFLGLLVAGPGRYSLDERLKPLVRLIRKFKRAP
jgi:putative oxidoreductase